MSTYALKQEQERLERDAVQMGIDRYMEATNKEESRGRGFDTPVAERVLRTNVRQLVPVMLDVQARGMAHNIQVMTKGGQRVDWGERVNLVSPEVLAYVTVKTVVVAAGHERRAQHCAKQIGQMVQCEYWWSEARRKEAQAAKARNHIPPNRIEMMKRKVKEVNPKTVKKWMKFMDDLEVTQWTEEERIHVGAACLDAALPHLGDLIYLEDVRRQAGRGYTMEKVLRVKPEFINELQESHAQEAMLRPWLMPMIVPPVPWVEEGGHLSGGYRILQEDLLKQKSYYAHTGVDAVPEEYLTALNRLQSTPWAINTFILDVAKDCFESDLGPLPYEAPKEFPELIKPEDWEAMSRSARGNAKAERAKVYDHNNVQAEKKVSMTRALTVAERFRQYAAIYFPHSIDWRGRAYPIPQDLHPQGSDMVKSMLTFAEGKPLGERGYDWLCTHAASTFGLDKHDRFTQRLWVEENRERVLGVGANPWAYMEFWLEADEPWQFLAACHELHQASLLEDPTEYVCALPISVDGSCNGLQHLSAMGLDPVGAKAVNLMPGERQDVYQIVADKVRSRVAGEFPAAKGRGAPLPEDHPACAWVGKVTRKTVKRGVMTTPYGVTPRGIATQLKQDGFTKGMPDELAAANYLRGHMVEAINDTIVKGKEVMTWMQSCAELLASEKQGISWTTPLGLKVTQMYTNPEKKQLRTLLGKLYIDKPSKETTVNMTKQRHAVAPNVIHSFDAAHMLMVVLSMPEGTSFAMVHDSYGVHACDVDELLEVTKAVFVEIYQHNWFDILRTDFTFYSDRQSMPPAPQRGDLDIELVLESDYFFA